VLCALHIVFLQAAVDLGGSLTLRAQLENVIGCDKIDAAQRKLICYLCGSRGGAPVQCAYGCCRAAYHVTCAMLAGVPLISKEEEKSDGIVMKSFCHKHGPRFCFRGRWVIDPKKTFVEQIDVIEGTLPAVELVQQLLASVIEHQRCRLRRRAVVLLLTRLPAHGRSATACCR
jgi:hypothetical protein